jgi:hypothetical protein
MHEWDDEHHAAWGTFITAPDNAGIYDLISDTRNRYENSLGVTDDSVAGDGG